MGPIERVRSRTSRVLGASVVTIAVAGLVTSVHDGVDAVVQYGAGLALFGLLGWAVFWRPYVEISDGGIVLSNLLRTVEVPWPAVDEVDGRYGLRLTTAYGVYDAWAAPAPSSRQRRAREPAIAARLVDERLERLRIAGYLDDRRLERPEPRVTWHVPLLVAAGALLLLTVLLPLTL